ncbi:MAG: hypothetical protein LBQ43_04400, partial [Holosporales bacterium]|nr:hypothetical protein [Holosporales bacterium]
NALNIAYVVTSSSDFQETLQRVIAGLNNAGFSERDCRAKDFDVLGVENTERQEPKQKTLFPEPQIGDDDFPQVDTDVIRERLAKTLPKGGVTGDINEDELFVDALKQAEEFDAAIAETEKSVLGVVAPEVREYMNVFPMNGKYAEEASALRLPQFVIKAPMSIFSDDEMELLTHGRLLEGFSLRDKDTKIDFSSVDAEIARVDVEDANEAPKAWNLVGAENQVYKQWFNSLPHEHRLNQCKKIILENLSKINEINDHDLMAYIRRVVDALDTEQQEDLQRSPLLYGSKIKKKIEALMSAHAESKFNLWVEQGVIKCQPEYAFKGAITPVKSTSDFPRSLYTHEEEMNGLERDVVWQLSGLPNIKWWHRNISRTGFNINGYVNAYPDIIACTENGIILMIEPKGDHLIESSESIHKANVGSVWAAKAGEMYRYYMVFKNKDLKINGAVQFDRFMEIVKGL